MSAIVAARGDLEWLVVVGAVREWQEVDDGLFRVLTATRDELRLTVDQVRVFRRGVLTGWRLPRPVRDG